MHLIIQIPTFNEENQIQAALESLPKTVPGIDRIEVVVLDDGSSDRTAEIASAYPSVKVMRSWVHLGLAQNFYRGVQYAKSAKADILVNFDADLQYNPSEINWIVSPLISGSGDFIIGNRPIWRMSHFSTVKKWLQFFGSATVSLFVCKWIPDVTSGFRGMNRAAIEKLEITSRFTYTLESILDLRCKGLTIVSVPVSANAPKRPSRLFKTNFYYIWMSLVTLIQSSFGIIWRIVSKTPRINSKRKVFSLPQS